MSFRPYPEYKDSGIGWLGAYPSHWATTPLWTCFTRVKRSGYEDEELLSVYRDYGVVPKSSRDDNFNKPSDDLSSYQLVEPNDLVVNKMKAWQGSVAISRIRGIVSPAYHVYRSQHEHFSDYLHNLMRSAQYITGYLSLSKGIRVNQWDLEPIYHSRMPLLIPSLVEQRAIAAFLDRETAKIDALVAEQRRLIELLKEKRQAVISHAVTKGLDPHVKMKHSGIEWLGMVPEHWEVGPLKRFWSTTDCKHITADFVEQGYPLASIREVQSRWIELSNAKQTTEQFYQQLIEGGRQPLEGDLIFSRNATVGEVAQVPAGAPAFAMGQDVCLLRRNLPEYSADYLQAVLRSPVVVKQIEQLLIGSTFKRINVEEIRGLLVPMPSSADQNAIAAVINEAASEIDRLAAEVSVAIALLQERRTALISAAVTGKIDVRDAA